MIPDRPEVVSLVACRNPPEEWIQWALHHGSAQLRRLLAEDYPCRGTLTLELIDMICPAAPERGLERSIEIPSPIRFGVVREPNAASLAHLDWIIAQTERASPFPRGTFVTVGQIRRVTFRAPDHVRGAAVAEVLATGVQVTIACRDVTIENAYIWSRNDR